MDKNELVNAKLTVAYEATEHMLNSSASLGAPQPIVSGLELIKANVAEAMQLIGN